MGPGGPGVVPSTTQGSRWRWGGVGWVREDLVSYLSTTQGFKGRTKYLLQWCSLNTEFRYLLVVQVPSSGWDYPRVVGNFMEERGVRSGRFFGKNGQSLPLRGLTRERGFESVNTLERRVTVEKDLGESPLVRTCAPRLSEND